MDESNIEIERKFLLSAVPPEVSTAASTFLRQGYIPGHRLIERVRAVRKNGEESFIRTIKLGMGVKRIEIEEETTREIFDVLWGLTAQRRLEKTRYFIPDGTLTWEIDVFADRELVLAEVELPSEHTKVAFPEWLSEYIVREVTDETDFTNWSLALKS